MAQKNVIKAQSEEAVNTTIEVLIKGGVIVYPTDTLYGLGALVSQDDAVQRIFEIKGRNPDMSLPVLVKDFIMLEDYAHIPVKYAEMVRENMPGAFMAILRLKRELNPIITGGKDTIGIRISSNFFVTSLMKKLDEPLVSTSANPSGRGNIYDITELIRVFRDKVDLIIDSGSISPSKGSTIVDFTCEPPKILREGDISRAQLSRYITIT